MWRRTVLSHLNKTLISSSSSSSSASPSLLSKSPSFLPPRLAASFSAGEVSKPKLRVAELEESPAIVKSYYDRRIVGGPGGEGGAFDPLAAPRRSATQSQLMNQHVDKCNPFGLASGIIGIVGARCIASQLSMYKIDGIKAEMKRSFSSSVASAASEKVQPNANIVRPLSPHLPIYKPQTNSIASIFNRISGAYLAVLITAFYLLTLKLGSVCFTFYPFYQLFFYSSKLALMSAEVAVLALAYHVFHSLPHLFADFSAILFLKRLGRRL